MNKEEFDKINVFGLGNPNDGFKEYFSGNRICKGEIYEEKDSSNNYNNCFSIRYRSRYCI